MYTIQKNNLGHLHIWKDNVSVQRAGKSNYISSDGKESDFYIQTDHECEAIVDNLTIKELNALVSGFPVKTENLNL